MKKFIYTIPFILGVCCFIAFGIMGSTIDANGFIHEPFFLIPVGYLFFFIGLISLAIKGLSLLFKKHARA